MKQIWRIAVLTVAVCLMVCGCAGDVKSYTVDQAGIEYTVDTDAGTITVRGNVYNYTIEDNKLEITYPDGSSYWCIFGKEADSLLSFGAGWSDDYSPEEIVKGETLMEVLDQELSGQLEKEPLHIGVWVWLLLIVCLAAGIWAAGFPYSFWRIRNIFNVKDGEPTDIALGFIRIVGMFDILAVAGIVLYVIFV